MDITPVIPKGQNIISGYGDGGFSILGERYEGSLIITTDSVTSWAGSSDFNKNDFAPIFALRDKPEIVLIGTGKAMKMLPPQIRAKFREQGMSVDSMDTGAACRTYNVLLSEGRNVAATLVAI